ncbi:MAG: (2Fe-2S)-binding protein [Candidatus Micrarchaeota archaeon]|nr:(2Fe-2S)-binding protein [Candidatus Micrarchaeota archaeon]
MPKVTFKKENIVLEVPAGTKLVDIAEKSGANINFSCKEGVCLTCLVNIVKGMENLNQKTENEKATLEAFGAAENQRLACQVVINGDVVIETLD